MEELTKADRFVNVTLLRKGDLIKYRDSLNNWKTAQVEDSRSFGTDFTTIKAVRPTGRIIHLHYANAASITVTDNE